jgi:hypothetical protein
MLVANHDPGPCAGIATVARIRVVTFSHKLGERTKPWFRDCIPQDLILLVVRQILKYVPASDARRFSQCREAVQDLVRFGNGASLNLMEDVTIYAKVGRRRILITGDYAVHHRMQ